MRARRHRPCSSAAAAVAVLLPLPAAAVSAPARPVTRREVTDQGYRIRLNLAGQVLRISLPEPVVFGDQPRPAEERLRPTLRDALG